MVTSFSAFVHDLEFNDLPEDLLALLRRSFLDTMGVAAIAAGTELSDIARRSAMALFGAGTVGGTRVLMDGRTCSPSRVVISRYGWRWPMR